MRSRQLGVVVALVAATAALVGASVSRAAPSVLRVNVSSGALSSMDPVHMQETPVDYQFFHAVCATLVDFPDAAAPAGAELAPELATSMPTISTDGKTYTFTLRTDARFSSGSAVTPADVKATFDRLAKKDGLQNGGGLIYDIVGGSEVANHTASSISGITTSGDTVSFTLTAPYGDFLARLAMPYYCVLPADTPLDDQSTPVTAGPYYVASADAGSAVLKRNPYYSGSRPSNFDEIDYALGTDGDASVAQIESGAADYEPVVPEDAAARLWNQYGPNSPAAAGGRQQYFANPTLWDSMLALNTTSGRVFSNVKLRQAVNFALDRPALAATVGSHAAVPTDQYLPPLLRGYDDQSIYPLAGPDTATAKALVDQVSGDKTVQLYTGNTTAAVAQGDIVKSDLEAVGFTVDVHSVASGTKYATCGSQTGNFDICTDSWIFDWPDASNIFGFLFDGNSIQPSGNTNQAYFDDPTYNARIENAQTLTDASRYSTYGELDVDLARDAAPYAAWGVELQRDFFSQRIGCQVYQPTFGMVLGALCVRPPAPPPPPPPAPPPPPPPPPPSPPPPPPSPPPAPPPPSPPPPSKPPVKKVTICYHHHTLHVTRATANRLRKHGAKLGACRKVVKKKHR